MNKINFAEVLNKYKVLGIMIIVAIVVIVAFSMNFSYDNKEVKLLNQYKAEEKNIEATYDNMWKSIKQIAQVTDKYEKGFKDIYVSITDKKYSKNDGTLLNFIKEANPNFDIALYAKLANTIEIERRNFLNSQEKIIDIEREHNNLLAVVPSKWFMNSDVKKLNFIVISSTQSKKVMKTRLDDNIEVF